MEKKIIAIALVLVVMVTAFVGCGQKYKTTKVGNNEYLLHTDAEGNTIIKDDQLVAVVTDRDGEIITYENGENQTYYVPIPGSLVIDGIVRGDNFTLNILDGWTSTDYNRIIKDKTDNKCYIQFTQLIKEFGKGENINTYLETVDKNNQDVIDIFADEEAMEELIKSNPAVAKYKGCTYTIEKDETVISKDNIPCQVRIHKAVDKDGNLIHYAENYYFMLDKSLYSLDYACEDGVGYDAEFDFKSYANQNFTFVK
ncbi:MAG: hypothetical protein IIV47_03585 [Clostridia bacterium]|nr:hypothetical protein [Clostridia bacterium]